MKSSGKLLAVWVVSLGLIAGVAFGAEKGAEKAAPESREKPAAKAEAKMTDAERSEAKKVAREKSSQSAEEMSLSKIAICEDVQERTPVGEAEAFSSEIGKLWCFTRVHHAEAPTQIFHRWYVGDKLVDEIPITVKGQHWRCWSTKTILPSWTGQCRVEILSEEGDVLATKEFMLEG